MFLNLNAILVLVSTLMKLLPPPLVGVGLFAESRRHCVLCCVIVTVYLFIIFYTVICIISNLGPCYDKMLRDAKV